MIKKPNKQNNFSIINKLCSLPNLPSKESYVSKLGHLAVYVLNELHEAEFRSIPNSYITMDRFINYRTKNSKDGPSKREFQKAFNLLIKKGYIHKYKSPFGDLACEINYENLYKHLISEQDILEAMEEHKEYFRTAMEEWSYAVVDHLRAEREYHFSGDDCVELMDES